MGTNVLNLLQRTFGETSVHYRHFAEHYGKFSEWESEFEDCRSIFVAAREDYEGGYLFNVRALAKGKFSRTSLRNQKNFSTLATRTQLVSWLASRSIQR